MYHTTRNPDADKEHSEKKLSLGDFLKAYNTNLPEIFPRATKPLLKTFASTHPDVFKNGIDEWSLGQHRKRVMDWMPGYLREHPAKA